MYRELSPPGKSRLSLPWRGAGTSSIYSGPLYILRHKRSPLRKTTKGLSLDGDVAAPGWPARFHLRKGNSADHLKIHYRTGSPFVIGPLCVTSLTLSICKSTWLRPSNHRLLFRRWRVSLSCTSPLWDTKNVLRLYVCRRSLIISTGENKLSP